MITYIKMLAVLLLPLSFIANYYVIRGCKKYFFTSRYDAFIISFCGWMISLYATTEILSLFHSLTYKSLLICWLTITLLCSFCAVRLSSNEFVLDLNGFVINAFTNKRILVLKCLFGILFSLMMVLAIVIPPNNYDSMVYHCTRVAHWAQNQSIAHFSTHTPETVASPYYSGSVFKTKNLSFYNESMLRVEREPLHHCNQRYAA